MKNITVFFLFIILLFYSIPSSFITSFHNLENIQYDTRNILTNSFVSEYRLNNNFKIIDFFLHLLTWVGVDNNICYNLNDPPGTPIIIGPESCRIGDIYNYSFCSTDPENNDVYYLIHWGDGNVFYWVGPFKSGVKVNFSYCWFDNPRMNDNFIIEAMAKDIHEAKSDWGYLEVVMPCDKFINLICLKS